ncbi:MAG: hypothetical protein ACR2FQ_08990 [Pseudonocardiaceae bacterium]
MDEVGIIDLRVRSYQIGQADSESLGDTTQGVPWLNDVPSVTRRDVYDFSGVDEVGIIDLRVRSYQIGQADSESLGDTTQGVSWLDDVRGYHHLVPLCVAARLLRYRVAWTTSVVLGLSPGATSTFQPLSSPLDEQGRGGVYT